MNRSYSDGESPRLHMPKPFILRLYWLARRSQASETCRWPAFCATAPSSRAVRHTAPGCTSHEEKTSRALAKCSLPDMISNQVRRSYHRTLSRNLPSPLRISVSTEQHTHAMISESGLRVQRHVLLSYIHAYSYGFLSAINVSHSFSDVRYIEHDTNFVSFSAKGGPRQTYVAIRTSLLPHLRLMHSTAASLVTSASSRRNSR